MEHLGEMQVRKRQRRRKIPRVVLERLQEQYKVSSRTICRWITAGEKDVVEAALKYVNELLAYRKIGRAKIGSLNESLEELYSLRTLPFGDDEKATEQDDSH